MDAADAFAGGDYNADDTVATGGAGVAVGGAHCCGWVSGGEVLELWVER